MTASSVTGTGPGESHKKTGTQLAILANAPSIMLAGTAENVLDVVPSPPTIGTNGTVHFPYPLEGDADNYVIMLTSVNGGAAFVASTFEDSDNNFNGFLPISEDGGRVHYLIVKKGIRPNV